MSAFDQPLPLDRIRDGDRLNWQPDDAARAEIAARLNLIALHRLTADVTLSRDGDAVVATGRVRASLDQPCVATGDAVPAMVDEAFTLKFLPDPGSAGAEEELELESNDLDVVFHDGAAIDLGAAMIDTLALALDPYPRSAAADAALRDAGVKSEEEMSPFAALSGLRDKLSGPK